jgi:transcriptional regulator GlxA family with amidase domain
MTAHGTDVRHIGILLFDQVEELDAVGPWEALAVWTRNWPGDGWAVSMIAHDRQPVLCANGLSILPHHTLDSAPALDVLIHPGGQGTRALIRDAEHLAWTRRQRAQVPLLTSVCTGSLVYAAAGLLAGRPATTHRSCFGLLRGLDATIDVREQDRFVDDGDIITSAGVSAGIDMALHLIGRLAGPDRAQRVRDEMQYEPAAQPA